MGRESGFDIEIQLSLTKVARIVEENAGFSVNSVKELGEGLDFRTFLINDSWALRFPKNYFDVHDPTAEQRLSQKLALSTNVPEITFIWKHPWGYPEKVSGYKYLPGKALEDFRSVDVDEGLLAQQLAKVLAELHGMAGEGVSETPDQLATLRNWSEQLDDELNRLKIKSISTSRKNKIKSYVDQYRFDLPNFESVLIHGDLGADHIILDQAGQLTGIIDWSNHTKGNKYRDFVGLWRWGGDAFCAQVLSNYTSNPSTPELAYIRVMGLVSCIAREIHLADRSGSVLHNRARALLEQRVSEITNKCPYDPL